MPYLIHHFLEESADAHPSKEAVVHGDKRLTYLEMEHLSNEVANWLIEVGIRNGDRVAILHRNSVDYIFFYYGIMKAGCVVVPLNHGLDASDLKRMIMDCTPRVLITERNFVPVIEKIANCQKFSFDVVLSGDELESTVSGQIHKAIPYSDIHKTSCTDRPPPACIDRDLATIVYSSGSTGRPKGVMLSHLNIVSNTHSITSYLPVKADDRCLVILPFYYVYGKSLLNTHFSRSATVIIDNRFAFPNAVLKTMIDEKVTNFSGVPSTYSILLNNSLFTTMSFPHLRYFTQAGGHLSSRSREQLSKNFPETDLFIMYGATEASARLAYLDPGQLKKRMNSCGKPIPNVEMKILTEDGNRAKPWQVGEIVARGPNIMLGYWNSPQETERALKDGWYYTGDLGYLDEDGFFYLTGRKRDMIKVGAFKVSAFEVEQVLYGYPGVREAAVVAGPDDTLGENVRAFVVCDPQTTISSEEIRRYCSDLLPEYKVPVSVEFLDEMPRNEAGKLMKHMLPTTLSFD